MNMDGPDLNEPLFLASHSDDETERSRIIDIVRSAIDRKNILLA